MRQWSTSPRGRPEDVCGRRRSWRRWRARTRSTACGAGCWAPASWTRPVTISSSATARSSSHRRSTRLGRPPHRRDPWRWRMCSREDQCMAEMRMIEAVRAAITEEMERDERVLVMGEDVGRKGGVFGATDGLYAKFGEARVLDTPLAESGIVGVAIGAALNGLIPIAEIQFADFIHPAFDQIVSEAARTRYRSNGDYSVPIGPAVVRREGSKLSCFAWGLMTHYCLQAADRLAAEGISVEVVDLRCLAPLDRDTILASVRKTGKAMVVYEDNLTGGFGAEIVAIISEHAFDSLDGPVVRVAAPDIPAMPFNSPQEDFFMPNPRKIADAMRKLAAY